MSEPAAPITDLSPQEKRALLSQLLQHKARHPGSDLPLSYGQQALWLTHQLALTSWAYNVLFATRVRSEVDTAALQRAFQTLLARHPMLRTTYTTRHGKPEQHIHDYLPASFVAVDAASWSEMTLRHRLLEMARQPFDLEHGPVLRVHLFSRATTDHVLLLTVHHIAIDMWSLGLMLEELRALYPAAKAGVEAPLPPLDRQYADFVRWQADLLAGPEGERLWAYWRQQLAGECPFLQLLTDRPRPPVQTYYGASYAFTLGEELTQSLKALARDEESTLHAILLAAFYVLLHRYTGQEDILVGAFTADRMRPEFRRIVGYFVNPVVLRADLSGNPPFRMLLKQVRQTLLEAIKHQDFPFPLLVERLQLVRDASRPTLFQVAFVFQQLHRQKDLLHCFVPGAPAVQTDFGGLVLEPFALPQEEGQFDLTLEMAEVGESLWGGLKYNTDLFEAATITRMAGHLQTVLANIAANPEQPLTALPLLTAAERQLFLVTSNTAKTAYASERCIHECFETLVEHTPDAVAVVYGDQQLTYQELNRRANQLAHYLRLLGIGPEVPVGMYLDRSLELVVGVLGVLKAGGAYVPLDPAYPPERLGFILEDAQVPVLLTQQSLVADLPTHGVQVVCLDTDAEVLAQQSTTNPHSGATADTLAYVIYTSGSTGKPKGVQVSHRNVVRLFTATQAWFRFDAQDVWTLFHSYAFDFSVWEIWGALLYGGRLVVVPFWVSRSPAAFYELLCRERVTVLNQTPSAFRQLMRAEAEMAASVSQMLALRLVIFGGEALDVQSLQPWFVRHGDQHPQLVNMYGITETTVHVTYRPLTMADVHATRGSPIGVPLPDLQVYVLDAYLQPVPIGVPGELYVGGAGVARGYLNRPELTAERFIAHPFSSIPGAKLYKSGDLVRYLPDRTLEYFGRNDQQVKIRGFRIELGEIETVLGQHPAVREAVVVAREDVPGEKRLVAYVVPGRQSVPAHGAWRDFLQPRLPEYMIPSTFVVLEALPLTNNGKLDRRALPVPGQARPELVCAFVAPRSTVERELAGIFGQILGIERVGIWDNFFELGGDSIRSMQIQARARDKGIHFALPQLFQYQTVAELAQVVSTVTLSPEVTSSSQAFSLISQADRARLPEEVEDAYPLTRLQAEMLSYSQRYPKSSVYHTILSYHLRINLNRQALEAAVHQLVTRHAVLRTSFHLNGFSEPLQLVHRTARIPFAVEDLRHLSGQQQEQAIATWIETEKERSFDWSMPPLLRLQLHRRSEETVQFTLSKHHAILDGWSVASMLTELFQHYVALLNATAMPVESPLALSFRDFVAQERQALSTAVCQHYWTHRLSGATMTMLPRNPSYRQTVSASQSRDLEVSVSPQVFEGLQRLARSARVSLKSVLLAAHLRVISLLSSQTEVLTGLVSHGRPEGPDAERVLGLFLNVVPLRLQLVEGSWRDLVQKVSTAEQEFFPFRHYPIAHLQTDKSQMAMFETAFNFIYFHVYQRLKGLKGFEYLGGIFSDPFSYTLKANCIVNPLFLQLILVLNYNRNILDEGQVQAISSCYIKTLTTMADNPFGSY